MKIIIENPAQDKITQAIVQGNLSYITQFLSDYVPKLRFEEVQYEIMKVCHDPVVKDLQSFINKEDISKDLSNKLVEINKVIPPLSDEKAQIPVKEEIERFVFHTYENQRWWLLRNAFTHSTYPGERKTWTDANGVPALKESFQLPGKDWMWLEDDWHAIVSSNTDKEGWSYSDSFEKPFHANNATLDFVRRRKWTRTCVRKVN